MRFLVLAMLISKQKVDADVDVIINKHILVGG